MRSLTVFQLHLTCKNKHFFQQKACNHFVFVMLLSYRSLVQTFGRTDNLISWCFVYVFIVIGVWKTCSKITCLVDVNGRSGHVHPFYFRNSCMFLHYYFSINIPSILHYLKCWLFLLDRERECESGLWPHQSFQYFFRIAFSYTGRGTKI